MAGEFKEVFIIYTWVDTVEKLIDYNRIILVYTIANTVFIMATLLAIYLAIRQRVVYERIVNEGELAYYSLIDNEGELSNCFSIHLVPRYINFEKIDLPPLHRDFQNNLINLILYDA